MADFDLGLVIRADGSQAVAEADEFAESLDRVANAEKRVDAAGKSTSTGTNANATAQKAAAGAANDHGAALEQLSDDLARTKAAASSATSATVTLTAAEARARAEASSLAAASSTLAAARARSTAATSSLAVAETRAAAAAGADAVEQARLAAAVDRARAAVAAAEAATARSQATVDRLSVSQRGAATANDNATNSANRQKAAMQNLSFQIQDVGASLSTVSGPSGLLRIFAQQGGQIFSALNEISQAGAAASGGIKQTGSATNEAGGDFDDFGDKVTGVAEKVENTGSKLGKVAGFLAGPWGAALLVAVTVLGPFVAKLFEADEALDEQVKKLEAAATAADSYGSAQSLLGRVIDLTTGKLKTQNTVLIQTIKLQAQANILAAQAAQKAGLENVGGLADRTLTENVGVAFKGIGAAFGSSFSAERGAEGKKLNAALAPLKADLDAYKKSAEDYARVLNDPKAGSAAIQAASDRFNKSLDTTLTRLSTSAKKGSRDVIATKQEVLALGTALNDQRANQLVVSALDGGPLDPLLKPYERPGKPKKPKKPKKEPSTTARDEFGRDAADTISGILSQFDGTPSLVREVNQQVAKLDDLIEDLGRKKPPNFQQLIADANTAKVAVREGLNRPYNEFILDQQRALENTRLLVEGRVEEAEAVKIIAGLERQMGPLTPERRDAVLATVQALKQEERQLDILREKQQSYLQALGSIKATIRDTITGGLDDIADVPKRLISAFSKLKGDLLFERLFGDVFRQLEDQVKGTSTVEDASDRMASAVDKASASITRLGDAAAGAVPGVGPTVTPAAGSAGGGLVGQALNAAGQVVGTFPIPDAPSATPGAANDNGKNDIVVTARKDPARFFSDALGKVSGSIAGLFTDPEKAKAIGTSIGSVAGKGLSGAATGALTNSFLKPLGNALGFKTSKTGAQIGGAIGSFIPIPGGDIIGSVIGSVVGGLFKKTKSGSATIGNVGGEGAVTGTSGNSSSYKKAASGLADSVLGSLDNVVEALGADLGDFSVSIGKRKKKFVVDSSGSGKTKGGSTTKYDTEEEAIAAALADAIADGAVKGLSGAMQRALQSTTDVDKAVKEALKVQTVEELIGGVGYTLEKLFKDFDRQAADYAATARKYGLDVVAVEKATAEKRLELIESTLNDQIGSLKDFLDDLKYGDLAEGSPVDQRKVLLDKIATVQKDAEAGKSGAADQLAQLYQQLLTKDREIYGTAGPEYANDRALAEANVQKVIDMATQRLNEASSSAATTVAAINEGNTLADENNALTAQLLASVNGLPSALAAILGGQYAGANANLAAVARAAVA